MCEGKLGRLARWSVQMSEGKDKNRRRCCTERKRRLNEPRRVSLLRRDFRCFVPALRVVQQCEIKAMRFHDCSFMSTALNSRALGVLVNQSHSPIRGCPVEVQQVTLPFETQPRTKPWQRSLPPSVEYPVLE